MYIPNNIKDLALEAGFITAGFGSGGVLLLQSAPQILKFAQLIIQDCVQIAELEGQPQLAEKIKKHFGV
jgi:hypothetical protein